MELRILTGQVGIKVTSAVVRNRGPAMGDEQYLSTGAAARLLGVTPDTVLKWIKRGRLMARRTAGGHYRVSRAALGGAGGAHPKSAAETEGPLTEAPPKYCWEYHAHNGAIRAECEQCKAYQAKALRCFELRCLPSGMGSPSDFCATTCDVCGYYRQRVHGPIRVLVVSDSVSLRHELQQGAPQRGVRLEFATREYECASIVESLRPEFALLDCTLPRRTWVALAECMAHDPRAAGIRIVLAALRKAKAADRSDGGSNGSKYGHIGLPLDWSELEETLGVRPASGATERSDPEATGRKPPRSRSA